MSSFGCVPFRADIRIRPIGSKAHVNEDRTGNDPGDGRGYTRAPTSRSRHCHLGAIRHPRRPAFPTEQFAKRRRSRTQVRQRRSGLPAGAAAGCECAHGKHSGLRLSFPTCTDGTNCPVSNTRSLVIRMSSGGLRVPCDLPPKFGPAPKLRVNLLPHQWPLSMKASTATLAFC